MNDVVCGCKGAACNDEAAHYFADPTWLQVARGEGKTFLGGCISHRIEKLIGERCLCHAE